MQESQESRESMHAARPLRTEARDQGGDGHQEASAESSSPSFWPEGVLAILAGVTLLAIGVRHRHYLRRKVRELQQGLEEFQRQGGVEEMRQLAQQAGEFLRGR